MTDTFLYFINAHPWVTLFLVILLYILGYFLTEIFLIKNQEDRGMGFIWPMLLGMSILVGPFRGLGWLSTKMNDLIHGSKHKWETK